MNLIPESKVLSCQFSPGLGILTSIVTCNHYNPKEEVVSCFSYTVQLYCNRGNWKLPLPRWVCRDQ